MEQNRILMFTMGKWSHSNAAIARALKQQLPTWELLEIDLLQEFKRERRNIAACIKDIPFMLGVALRELKLDYTNIIYAPATARHINALANRLKQQHRPSLTLQTTTRFDASGGGIPHFTVIDSTLAAVRHRYREKFNASNSALDRLSDFQQRIFSSSNGVFTMGRYVRDSLVKDYGIAPHLAVAIGAGPNIELGLRSNVVSSSNILFVGTHWERKGGPILLEAFRRIKHRHPGATLTIVGCHPVINEPGVNVVGRVSKEHLHQYFSQARVFALPTEHEAFGIAFVEALHFGLPIIATGINAIPEMVENGVNGYTIALGDVEAMATALDKIYTHDLITRDFSNASFERASQFTWEQAGRILSENILHLAKHDQAAAGNSRQTPHRFNALQPGSAS